jgi:BON domain-containing protein
MPNYLDVLTKPLQIGARITFGAIQTVQHAVQGLTGGDHHEEPPRRKEPRSEARPAPRPARPKPLDDATITAKVETVIFRSESVAKGKIDVNTADAVVWLRGEAKTPEQIKELEAKALAIPEVTRVENLLHLPKTPAPAKARRTKGTATARKRAPKRVSSERKTTAAAKAEPTPKKLAETGKGRQPAPLGASDGGDGGDPGGSTSG